MQTQTPVKYQYTDSSFNILDAHHYTLDITMSEQRITFSVYKQQQLAAFKYYNLPVISIVGAYQVWHNCLNHDEWVKAEFKNKRLFIDTAMNCLVPEALFDAAKPHAYLTMLHAIDGDYHTQFSYLHQCKVYTVFAIPNSWQKIIDLFFSPVEIKHQHAVLLEIASQFNAADLKQHLLVNVSANKVTILFYAQNEIKFLNTFLAEADTDITYFVLSVAEMLKIQTDKLGIYLMGQVNTQSSTVGLLKKYIPQVHFVSRPSLISHPLSFREFQEHQNYLEIHTLLCA